MGMPMEEMGHGRGMGGRMDRDMGMRPPTASRMGPEEMHEMRRQRRAFERRERARQSQEPIYHDIQPEQAQDIEQQLGEMRLGERQRRRLISGIDEEGFYHGPDEAAAGEGIASEYWGNSSRNSINLGEDGAY